MKKKIRWQPDTAQSIIYWSSTFIILFSSLILSLENTGPYWKSDLIMGLFFVFLFLGLRRSFVLKEGTIRIKYAAFWRDRDVSVNQIKEVDVKKRKVSLSIVADKEPFVVFMKRKAQAQLLDHVKNPVEKSIIQSPTLGKKANDLAD